ncbi:MAG: FAD-dependent monooxygenase [Betaproteobacteria bacterium]
MNVLLPSKYDVIVVGGGPAGATAAILLTRAGKRVAVVEKIAFPRSKVCGEFVSATTWPLLHALGVVDELTPQAGPLVRRVGVFAGTSKVTTPMNPLREPVEGGRAVNREILDTELLGHAAAIGATVWQPFAVTAFTASDRGYLCTVENRERDERRILEAPLIVAAHGSWEAGPLPTQQFRKAVAGSDLLGFKARFHGGALDGDLMPLIAFPGGYGGMVNTGGQRISLSCCIRRDHLEAARARHPRRTAWESVLAHILAHCAGVAEALEAASCDGKWIGAGPIRPGIRTFGAGGVFAVGNAAAEAHPVVAEGISIAIQSATLLVEALTRHLGQTPTPSTLADAHSDYQRMWRRNFTPRMRASALYAQIFMRPLPTRIALGFMTRFPSLLRIGAAWSGKARSLQHGRSETAPGMNVPTGEKA